MNNKQSTVSSLQNRNIRVVKFEVLAGDAKQEHDNLVSFETSLGYDIKKTVPDDQLSLEQEYYFCTITLYIDGKSVYEEKSQYEVHYLSCCEFRCNKEGITEEDFLAAAENSGLITLISNARAQIQGATALLGYINPFVFPLLNISAVINDHREAAKDTESKKQIARPPE